MLKKSQIFLLYIRSSLFFSGMVLYTIFHATLGFFSFPFPRKYRYRFITLWSRIILWWLKVTCKLQHKVIGLENLPKENGIILCKHQSMWETLGLQVIFPEQTWLLKRELLRIPFFGWALRLLRPIGIDRSQKSSAMEQLMLQGKTCLEQGLFIVIFPEGTRVAPGDYKAFSKGGARVAQATGYPLIPVAHNAGTYWRRRGFLKYPGLIQVVIGEAILPKNKTPEVLTRLASEWINKTVDKLENKNTEKEER